MNIGEALKMAGAENDLQTILRVLEEEKVGFNRQDAAAGPFTDLDTAVLTGLDVKMLSVIKYAQQQQQNPDRIQLEGKIAVLQRGDFETGEKRLLSLFKMGNELDLQKNGKPAGRLLLLNINSLVPGTMPARVEVLGAQEDKIKPFLPRIDGNGLSQELFVYGTVIRVSPCQGLHSVDGMVQDIVANCSAVVQGTISNCSAFAKNLRFQVAHGHQD